MRRRHILQGLSQAKHTFDWEAPTGIQFIAIAHPIDATRLDVIKSDKIEVSWYTVEVLNSKLKESGEQILGDVDFLDAHGWIL